MLFSLWCAHFGPPWHPIVGTAGFLFGAAALTFGASHLGRKLFGEPWPGLSQQVPALGRVRRLLAVLIVFFAVGAVAGIIVSLCGGFDGGPDPYPVFARRPSYFLYGGRSGRRGPEVSRLRYVLVGSGFFVGWHSLPTFGLLASLYYVLFGEVPGWMRSRRGAGS
jgi:hypothetical protein